MILVNVLVIGADFLFCLWPSTWHLFWLFSLLVWHHLDVGGVCFLLGSFCWNASPLVLGSVFFVVVIF